ncbi:MAG: mycothiol system anti-sigma-R factor [Acidimicrobiales bacterium]|nr:mycothiol system anti-sigma-R factor [Acidimicrobiales bacterium]
MAEDCNETLRELYLYLDEELTEEVRDHIARHLDECSPCLEAYDFEAELRIVVKSRCVDSVPEELRARISRALDREKNP